jgi:hypothetical protein
LSENKKSNAS